MYSTRDIQPYRPDKREKRALWTVVWEKKREERALAMQEPDELYVLRNNFWLGNYQVN